MKFKILILLSLIFIVPNIVFAEGLIAFNAKFKGNGPDYRGWEAGLIDNDFKISLDMRSFDLTEDRSGFSVTVIAGFRALKDVYFDVGAGITGVDKADGELDSSGGKEQDGFYNLYVGGTYRMNQRVLFNLGYDNYLKSMKFGVGFSFNMLSKK